MCNVPNHISLQLNNAAFFSRRELVFTSRDIVITSCLHWLFTMSWLRSNQTSSIVVRVANTWQTFKYVQNKLVKPLPTFHSSMPRKKIHQNVVYTNLLHILPSSWFTTAAIFFTTCELKMQKFSPDHDSCLRLPTCFMYAVHVVNMVNMLWAKRTQHNSSVSYVSTMAKWLAGWSPPRRSLIESSRLSPYIHNMTLN